MFYDKFVELCVENEVKPSAVANFLGISKSTVSCWKTRGTTPTDVTMKKICDYFGIDKSYFSNKPQKEKAAPANGNGMDATAVLVQAVEALNKFNSAYFKLNDKNRAIADNLIEALLKFQDNE